MGQSTDARDIVDVLKKNVLMVAELVASMQLGDASGPSSTISSPNPRSAPSVPTPPPSLDTALQKLLNPPPPTFSAPATTPTSEPNLTQDPSDMSRKRCASSVAGPDRALKSLKLEPQDDILMPATHPLQPPILSAPAPLTSFSFPPPMPSIIDPNSLPPSVPTSRPQSPSRISHSLNMLQDLHTSLHFPSHLDPQSAAAAAPDFAPVSSAPATAPTPVSSVFAPWPDNRTAIPRHQHSLSGNSVLSAVHHPTMPVSTAPPALQYPPTAPVGFTSPTRSTHPPIAVPVPVPNNSATLASIRSSRSSSISHPFAYSHPEAVHPPSVYEVLQSRPSTSGLYSTRPSSPDYDNDADGENDSDDAGEGSPPQGHHASSSPRDLTEDTKPGLGDSSMEGIQPSSSSQSSGRRMSRTSPPSESGGSTPHVNEVPTEYRQEVERIFFEFLVKTCSNRKHSRVPVPSRH